MKKNLTRVLALLLLSIVGVGLAEDRVHPRVAEIEQALSSSAGNYLARRFPEMPFLVSVKIDPLFRSETRANVPDEQLPYFDLAAEEILDEWDDRSRSLIELQRRVRKIVVNILVPNQLAEAEADEIREYLVGYLQLNSARDEVHINRRSWTGLSVDWFQVGLYALGLLTFLAGLLGINRVATGKIAKALEDSARKSAPAPSGPTASSGGGGMAGGKAQGDFQMHDPVKVKDLAVRAIDVLSTQPGFPSHQDIFELHEVGNRSSEALGAVLVEFPAKVLEKIFAFSVGDNWLKALNDPGTLEFESLNLLRKLLRTAHDGAQSQWSGLVLSVWRLTPEQRLAFLRGLDQKESIAILKALPTSMSLSSARQLYPGGWAQVLESKGEVQALSPQRSKELAAAAQKVSPLRNVSEIGRYREYLELVEHLSCADPYEERDIYQVLPPDSPILKNRPPFYSILEASESMRRDLSQAFIPEDWARAMADIKHSDKARIEEFFSDKQKFLYQEALRKVDLSRREQVELTGQVRRRIADHHWQLSQNTAAEASAEPSIGSDERAEPGMDDFESAA